MLAYSKRKALSRKKFDPQQDMVVCSLKKENSYLRSALFEMSRQHSEHNKLVERFLSLEAVRLECFQNQKSIVSEQPSKKEEESMNGDSAADEQTSANKVSDLQNHLNDALEKNKRWLEYDQQREAYVRAILDRMLWLKKQLNEANHALSQQQQQHNNKEHSGEKDKVSQMQEYYEKLLGKAKEELEVLREQVHVTQQNLNITQNWCKEREDEVEELKQQLQTENVGRKISLRNSSHHYSTEEDEEQQQQLTEDTKELQGALEEEKRKSASFEVQASLCQKYILSRYQADQETIDQLKRQIKISAQDLEDEKQDCLYLKKQMVKVLRKLQKTKDHATKPSKREERDRASGEATSPPCLASRDYLTSSPRRNSLNESSLECPGCRAEYPACHYRELMHHLEGCLDLADAS